MAEFYFFTEPDKLNAQTAEEAFGPVDENNFQLSCRFSGSDLNAYTTVEGRILIQPGENPDRVNILLKPGSQPIDNLNVRYFIYRGLSKDQFILPEKIGNEFVLQAEDDNSTEFMKLIWAEYKSLNESVTDNSFLAKWIGYNPDNQNLTDNLDQLFFSNDFSADTHHLPFVPAGIQLGKFEVDGAFEIYLDSGDFSNSISDTGFQANISFATREKTVVDLNVLPPDTSALQYKETIYQFLDPAAYFGQAIVQNKPLKVRNGDSTIEITGNTIYQQVLNKFHTKNNLYFYLTAHRGRSYNFYKQFQAEESLNTIKTGISTETLSETHYSTLGWPLLVYDQSEANVDGYNQFYFQLKNTGNPIIYKATGLLEEDDTEFLLSDDLVSASEASESAYTNTFQIRTPNIDDAGVSKNIASICWLYYQSGALEVGDETDSSQKILLSANSEIFRGIGNRSLFVSDPNLTFNKSIVNHQLRLSQLSHLQDEPIVVTEMKVTEDFIDSGEGEISIANQRITYETIARSIYTEQSLYSKNSSASSQGESASIEKFDVEVNNFYQVTPPYYTGVEFFSDGNEFITGLTVQLDEPTGLPVRLILGITQAENDQLKALISSENFKNVSIFLDSNEGNNQFISAEGKSYYKFKIRLIVESATGVLQLAGISPDIVLYSLDLKYFFSKAYSKYVPESVIENLFELVREDLTPEN